MGLLVLIGIFIVIGIIVWISSLINKASQYDLLKPKLDSLNKYEKELVLKNEESQRNSAQRDINFMTEKAKWEEQQKRKENEWHDKMQREKSDLGQIINEKTKGFPWLANAFADYYRLNDMKLADYLETKSHPAKSTADQIRKEIASKRREAEQMMRIYKYQIHCYEGLFPWLNEFREIDDDELIARQADSDYDSEEKNDSDPIARYLTEGEAANLTREQKFQKALDRYWRSRKTNWQIGRDYERYIGYLFEKDGWDVAYKGIEMGLSDLGRDLIITKQGQVKIIQCKCWAQHKAIHEKHIFQLYGTTIEYWISELDGGHNSQQLLFDDILSQNPVKAIIYTSTTLSDDAKKYAKVLGIEYKENMPLRKYPCIKCNATKIYHLPFDQQYDRTKILDPKTEKYVETIAEAEKLGYRRAYRWRG
jgi:hypothetical protein